MSLVVCPEVHAARAGRDVMADGGNAMDAAVAAAFVQGVTNHLLCGIGGSLSIYWRDGATGTSTIVNAEQTAGSGPVPEDWVRDLLPGRGGHNLKFLLTSRANEVGYGAIMVPSFVQGCWTAFRRFGSQQVTWERLLSPAARLARRGFEVTPYGAGMWSAFHQRETAQEARGVSPKWEINQYAAELMLKPDGSPYDSGDHFAQPDLARTLERLATRGGSEFYSGSVGSEIARDLAAHGSLVTPEDLHDYEALEDEPLRGEYRGMTLEAQPYSNGGHLIEAFQILDHFDLAGLGLNSDQYIDTVAKAMRAASSDYLRMNGLSRAAIDEIEPELIAPARAAYWADRIRTGDPLDTPASGGTRGTTHLTVADDAGNIVSLNHSIGYGGSGVVTPGLGFLYNGDMAIFDPRPDGPNSINPNKRHQGGSPLAVLRDGEPYIVVGAPGGTRIVTSIIQSVINIVDHGLDVRTAVTMPRFHSQDSRSVFLEPAFPEATADGLRRLGNTVLRSRYQARPQAIAFIDGGLQGGSDPRGQSSVDVGEGPSYDWSADPAFVN